MHSKHLMVGLPSSGKTTFLAALWHVLESEDLEQSLRLYKLEGSIRYLQDIRKKWIMCEKLERTTVNPITVSMLLENIESGQRTEIMIPDISGECYIDQQWEKRKWTREFAELAESITGVLLFVHPYRIKEPILICYEEMKIETQNKDILDKASWNVKDFVSTQVILVDLIQMLLSKCEFPSLQLGVVISAWDIVENLEKNLCPKVWLNQNLPLLDQYLKANREIFSTRIYGISAQGDKLENAEKLKIVDPPSKRIKVICDGKESDITDPIHWIMKESQNIKNG